LVPLSGLQFVSGGNVVVLEECVDDEDDDEVQRLEMGGVGMGPSASTEELRRLFAMHGRVGPCGGGVVWQAGGGLGGPRVLRDGELWRDVTGMAEVEEHAACVDPLSLMVETADV
jgi:hypothetical protein